MRMIIIDYLHDLSYSGATEVSKKIHRFRLIYSIIFILFPLFLFLVFSFSSTMKKLQI